MQFFLYNCNKHGNLYAALLSVRPSFCSNCGSNQTIRTRSKTFTV